MKFFCALLFASLFIIGCTYSKKEVDPVIEIYGEPDAEEANELNGVIRKKRFCRIYVKDNGIGFDQKYAEQIFDMFVRLHGNSEYQGTGIGLALCKQIVEKHQGFISALSNEKEGSTFIISLPM